jgi:ubiquinone/menaquinone biosynthesis C-methylase UbiE
MDYDLTDIPAAYDRGRDHGPEMLSLWMDAIESHLEGRTVTRILDLGCGTGRFSEALAVRFGADVVAADPSMKMLAQAREKQGDGRVQYQRGRAEAIPLLSHSVDMIFISMSFHHFTDPSLATRECRRVLRKHGRAFVRAGTRENIPAYPYVPFFPSTRSMLEELLPDHAGMREVFETAGFHLVSSEIVMQTIAPTWGAYAEKLSAGADSVLIRLSRQELESGLAELRSHSVEVDDQNVVEPIDFFVFQ